MRKYLAKATNILNRNTGFLILVAIIIFGFATIGFQKDNQHLLEGTSTTIEQTKATTENTERIIQNLEVAVKDLKADNARQTLIIQCLLVVHGETQFVSDEAAEACQVIQNQAASGTVSPMPENSPDKSNNNGNNNSNGNGEPPANPPGQEPGFFEGIINNVRSIVSDVL